MQIRRSSCRLAVDLINIDCHSRTIVENSFAGLVDHLQEEYRESYDTKNSYTSNNDWYWKTRFEQKSANHWILSVCLLVLIHR